jgi:hypothetical protein
MTQLATLETRLREAEFVIEQDPNEPEARRILADRQDAVLNSRCSFRRESTAGP